LEAALKKLLDPAGPARVLQLHAPGGLGKTQFLRWAVARHLGDLRVPVARLDFDEADAAGLAEQPGTLGLVLARPFGRPLPNAPFQDLLGHWGRTAARWAPGALPRFAAVLADVVPPDGAALLILDPLEEVLLPRKGDLLPLLGAAAGLLDVCPPLRLI